MLIKMLTSIDQLRQIRYFQVHVFAEIYVYDVFFTNKSKILGKLYTVVLGL